MSAKARQGWDIQLIPCCFGKRGGQFGGGRRQGRPMMTVRTAMASLLPAAICAQRPGDAIHGCIGTLLWPPVPTIWPESGNESFQIMQSLRHGGQKTARQKKRGRHPSTHDATHLRPRIDRPRGSGRSTAAQTFAALKCSAWASPHPVGSVNYVKYWTNRRANRAPRTS